MQLMYLGEIAMYKLKKEEIRDIGLNFVFSQMKILTPMGRNRIKNLEIFGKDNKEKLLVEFSNISYCLDNIINRKEVYTQFASILSKIKDISGTITNLKNQRTLDIVELYEVKLFSYYVNSLIKAVHTNNISIQNFELQSLNDVYALLDPEGMKLPTFMIYDDYCENLSKIRKDKKRLEQEIRNETNSDLIEKTLSKRRDLVYQEEIREQEIRKELTKKLGHFAYIIEKNINLVTYLDLLIAKAKLAKDYKCNCPKITDTYEIHLDNMNNPYFNSILKEKGSSYVPVGLKLQEGATVITGANMGGKSLTLKTLLLNVTLAQLGFFVFADYVSLPVLDYIYMIMDDLQSVNRGLSSFGAEIKALDEAIDLSLSGRGLIVMDELARGTNPQEGKAIVNAVVRFLNDKDTFSVISTHYDSIDLKDVVQYRVRGLKNIDFDKLSVSSISESSSNHELLQQLMDYTLEKCEDEAVPKDALNICKFLGLNQELYSIIKKYYEE